MLLKNKFCTWLHYYYGLLLCHSVVRSVILLTEPTPVVYNWSFLNFTLPRRGRFTTALVLLVSQLKTLHFYNGVQIARAVLLVAFPTGEGPDGALNQFNRLLMNFHFITTDTKINNHQKANQWHNISRLNFVIAHVNNGSHNVRENSAPNNGHN